MGHRQGASNRIAIGAGSGYANAELGPGAALAGSGLVDYMVFDCLAERTLALAHVRRMRDPSCGHDERIEEVVDRYGAFLRSGGRIIGNFGAANPDAAASQTIECLRRSGLQGTKVGVIHGDDVVEAVLAIDADLPEMGTSAQAVRANVISANAYIGAEPIVAALEQGAGFTLGGRLADPSMYVAAICHELGWELDDWPRLGHAVLAGHLLECGIHGVGGNFADPPLRTVPDPHDVGEPMASVDGDEVVVGKLAGTGGAVNGQTMRSQLLYEIHDPAAYLTPDVTADFSQVVIEDLGQDRVRLTGATGTERPDLLKVLVGLDLGWKGVGEISFGGPNCLARARLAEDIVRRRLEGMASEIDEIRYDLVGLNSLFGDQIEGGGEPNEVRFRVAARSRSKEVASAVAKEAELLYFGPAGGAGATQSVVPAVGVTPAFVPREAVNPDIEVLVA